MFILVRRREILKSIDRYVSNVFSIRAPRIYLRGPFTPSVRQIDVSVQSSQSTEKTLRGRSGLSPNIAYPILDASQLRVSTGLSPVSSLKVMPQFPPQYFLSMDLVCLCFI